MVKGLWNDLLRRVLAPWRVEQPAILRARVRDFELYAYTMPWTHHARMAKMIEPSVWRGSTRSR